MTQLTLKVNGREVSRDVAPTTLLVDFIRGTKRGVIVRRRRRVMDHDE